MSAEIKFDLSKMPIDKLFQLASAINDTTYEDLTLKTDFLTRYESVDSFYEEFLKNYISIEAAKKAGFVKSEHMKIYDEYEQKLYFIKSVYNTFYKQASVQKVNTDIKPEIINSHNRFHIPNIQIPTFSGKITEYINFRNIFISLIHDDSSLKPIQKLHYLVSCLKDDALQIIKHLSLCDDNYSVAFNILEKRYYNTRIIAEKHLDALLAVQLNGKTSLRIFLDIINENILALKAMKFNVDEWSFILLHLTLKKLPMDLRNRFELQYSNNGELPTFSQLIEFLEKQCKANEACNNQDGDRKNHTFSKQQVSHISKAHSKCVCCNGEHYIFACSTFRNMEVPDRNKLIRKSNLCWNCLHPHRVQQCTSNKRCKMCNGKHNSLLHIERPTASGSDSSSPVAHTVTGNCMQTLQSTVKLCNVIVGTTLLHIRDEQGVYHEIRGLVDPGSTCSLITEACVQRLRLKRHRAAVSIAGVGGEDSYYPNSHIKCTIKPIHSQEPQLDIITCSMKKITKDLPLQNIGIEVYKRFTHLDLADRDFHISRPIDILLGGDVFNEIMNGGKFTIDSTLPSAYSSIFGYIIIGKIPNISSSKNNELVTHVVTLDNLIQNFWELEQVPESAHFSPEDDECEKHFTNSISRTQRGRFIARLYDPCGYLTPVIFFAKSILQDIWLLKIGWDDIIPNHISDKWNEFISQLGVIQNIQINRCVVSLEKNINYQLHGFSDASEKGFAIAIYLRSEDHLGNIDVHLLLGKSKLAPVKQRLSIPRMELCGVHLLSKSLKYIQNILDSIHISSVHAWCDSKVALSWIRTPLHQLKSFEANRVSQIHSNCDINIWRYVPSSLNSSDCASRGLLPNQLVNHKLWWKPPLLFKSSSEWPVENITSKHSVEDLETDIGLAHVVENHSSWDIIDRYSSFSKLVRITAYCMRFIHNIRNKKNKYSGSLTVVEWDNALLKIIKNVQSVEFSKDIKLIKHNMNHRTTFYKLRPFLDSNDIIRIDGRLHKSTLSYEAKHPIILPKGHSLTILIIKYYHNLYLHAGPSLTLSNIRQRYWIISGRSMVRQIIHQCMICFRVKPKTIEPLMATLPQVRVQQARVFLKTGCDFAGPFFMKSSTLRNAKIQKIYPHQDFWVRLIDSCFCSDGGTNFVGLKNHLKEVHEFLQNNSAIDNITSYLTERHITFHRNPPAAPHMGGLWERTISSMKSHMRKIVGETRLTFEELYTLATKVEAILNSRPICAMSDNPQDFDILTPGHFIIGEPLLNIPEKCVENTNLNSLGRWELIKKFNQQIWRRWHLEYLHTLHQRTKWNTDRANVKINDLVLIKDDNLPPLQWKMARIVKLHPGSDNIVRVVELRTSKGNITRPLVKICPLPLE